MDLLFNAQSDNRQPTTLELRSSLSYSNSEISGNMELFLFVPTDLKIKSWTKNEIFSDFSCRISLPTVAADEVNLSNVVYEISLLQRLIDEIQIHILKGHPLIEIKNEVLTQARHLAALFEEYFSLPNQRLAEMDLVVQLAQNIIRRDGALKLPGIKELDQHLAQMVATKGMGEQQEKDFVQRQAEIPVDVYNKLPHGPVTFITKFARRFGPDRIRILNERNREFGTFHDWFRVIDVGQLPGRVARAIHGYGAKHDVVYFRRKFNLRSYLKNDYPCGIKEVLKFNLQKVIRSEPQELYAYANISLSKSDTKIFFRRQPGEVTAKFFKIAVNIGGIESIEQVI